MTVSMVYFPVKKILKKAAVTLLHLVQIVILITVLILTFDPAENIIFSLLFGGWYTKAASVELKIGNETKILSVYKGKDKPFLLLGPIELQESGNDFFFVNRKHVIRSSNDKCEDAWFRFFHWLFIVCDFTSTDCVRTDVWDDMDSDPGGSIRLDEKTQTYHYFFHVDSKTVPVAFELPARLFTEDMDRAEAAALEQNSLPDMK